jgi:AraC-like DNA-binding protein
MVAGTIYSGPQWQRYATSDTDEAYAFFHRTLMEVRVRYSGQGPEGAGLRTAHTQLDGISVARMHYSARTRLETAPAGDLVITHLMGGHYCVGRGKDQYLVRPGESVLAPPEDAVEVEFDDIDALAIRLPRALLEEVADAQTGIGGRDLRFDSSRPISAPLGRHWAQTLTFVTRTVLSDANLMANPLIAGQARYLLASTALAVFPNTSLDARQQQPSGEATSQVLRRAMAYVEENADRAIVVSEMAAAAGVRPRALQLAFRRHRDTTPMQYARGVRLERAHRDLRAGDPTAGTTVAMIANRWGFSHLGRFSTDYRAAYGASPSHTLRT